MISKPYFEISKKTVLAQYSKARDAADIVSYSSKTNPNIVPILEEETDSLFSLHMEGELIHVKDKSRVLFLAQAWDNAFISELVGSGVFRFVVDNEADLDILSSWLENNTPRCAIELFLRIKLKENTLRTERHFVFGMKSELVNKKIAELKDKPKIAVLGVHFHRKTQNLSEWNLIYDIKNMLSEESLDAISIINIGGGLPSEYANTNVEVVSSIFKKIAELRSFLDEKEIKLMVEPGRFIAAPSGKLITHIMQIYDNNIIIDASVYNSDMDAVIVPVKLIVAGELKKGDSCAKPYVIKGCTPCSVDLFRYRVYLDSPELGDKLVFLNAGAYNFSTDFCELKKLETKIID